MSWRSSQRADEIERFAAVFTRTCWPRPPGRPSLGALATASAPGGGALGQPGLPLESITAQLTDVIAGLDTAFVTTGEGLVAALAIHLLQVLVRRQDETFLDELREACTAEIVARVRLVAAKDA